MSCKVIAGCTENFGISLSIQSSSRNVQSASTDYSTISFPPAGCSLPSPSRMVPAGQRLFLPLPAAPWQNILYFHSSLSCSLQIQRKMCPLCFQSQSYPVPQTPLPPCFHSRSIVYSFPLLQVLSSSPHCLVCLRVI